MLPNEAMNPRFEATVQATEGAIVNAMVVAETMTGIEGRNAPEVQPPDAMTTALAHHPRHHPAQHGRRGGRKDCCRMKGWNPLFEATVQATEEAIVNAMVVAETMTGPEDRNAPELQPPYAMTTALAHDPRYHPAQLGRCGGRKDAAE